MRTGGYLLEIGYNLVKIATCEGFKDAVAGIPNYSFLIMIPDNIEKFPPHFILLRVINKSTTPLENEDQKTLFEIGKRGKPIIDNLTKGDLQWDALSARILGMYYPSPDNLDKIEFSSDLLNISSAISYTIYSPDEVLLDLIVNSLVASDGDSFSLGVLRQTECRFNDLIRPREKVDVKLLKSDFMGTRTAIFGKTRLGKSNVVKLIAESLINVKNVSQLIFDIDGEYANDNPQDDSMSLATAYNEQCVVYSSNPRNINHRHLMMNFYLYPNRSHRILRSLLREGRSLPDYVNGFINAMIPSTDELEDLSYNIKIRSKRRILMYWAILYKAGFAINESSLPLRLNPRYNENFLNALYGVDVAPPSINTLEDLKQHLERIAEFIKNRRDSDPVIQSTNGNPLFDIDDRSLLRFLNPVVGRSGTRKLIPFRNYHNQDAGDCVEEIINILENEATVILDLGNANPEVRNYYSEEITSALFHHQEDKFTRDELKNKYVQLYFEEAHNLFPAKSESENIYRRIAKEGAKFHIGMVYCTQSPRSIDGDLLNQTENFFVTHISSQREVDTLAILHVAFEDIKETILNPKTVGYLKMITRSHRFVIFVQAKKFLPLKKDDQE